MCCLAYTWTTRYVTCVVLFEYFYFLLWECAIKYINTNQSTGWFNWLSTHSLWYDVCIISKPLEVQILMFYSRFEWFRNHSDYCSIFCIRGLQELFHINSRRRSFVHRMWHNIEMRYRFCLPEMFRIFFIYLHDWFFIS